ncbi:unnamed protein product, partial [Prorocentrum cordatum]
MTRQEDFGSDWTLPGPRTAARCMSYLQREGLGIEGHHEHFRQICKLSATDWGVQEHYQLCQQIKAATCQDLLDGTSLISIEMKFRRLQTIEFAYWDKAKDAESKGVGGKMSLEEQAAFSGVSRSTSSVMVSPELIEHVRGDVEKEAKLHKSLRLAREERESRRRPRDILPLPYPSFREPLDKASVKELARGTRQRIGRRLGVCSDVYGCVDALNWLHDPSLRCGRDRPARYVGPSLARSQCLAHISESVRNLGPPPSTLSPAEALVQLRVAGGAYNVEQSHLGSCDPALLSLSDVSTAPAPLADVFTEPLGARLATGDAFGMLEMASDDSLLTVGGADLKGAFYHPELPEQLRPCFRLRPVRAGALGIKEVGGVSVGASTKLYPRLRVVRMGWSWAMWWCQSVMERVAEAAGCGDYSRLRDGRPAPSLDPSCHLEYVDNFVSIGYDAEAVRSAVTRVMTELSRRGPVVTREEPLGDSEGEFAVLGWSVTAAGRLSASASRLWRARLAVRGFLRRGRASGRDLERVLGHIIFVTLAQREGLSIFEACFRFVQKCYHQQVPLWSQVRQELMAWD